MKKSIIAGAAVAAVLGFGAVAPASAAGYVSGGPSNYNGQCQVSTDGYGSYGYVTDCPKEATPIRHIRHVKHVKHIRPAEKPQS